MVGFIIVFDKRAKKQTQWCIGVNRQTYVEIYEILPTGAHLTPLSPHKAASITANRWYDIQVKARGGWIECFLDGNAVFKVPRPDRWGGKVGLSCLRMAGRFKDIEVRTPDGKVLWEGPPDLGPSRPPK